MTDYSTYDRLAQTAASKVEQMLNEVSGMVSSYGISDSDKRRFDCKAKVAELWIEVLKACRPYPEVDYTNAAIEAIRRANTP